jgi:hypothetical protein
MSALLAVLVAGLAMADGPARASSQVTEALALDGLWEGSYETGRGMFQVSLSKTEMRLNIRGQVDRLPWMVEDQGQGKLRVKRAGYALGIYKREAGCLLICLRVQRDGRPTSFVAAEGQVLLVLRPVRPSK